MTNVYSNLTTQLNYLIGLLDISSRESFDKIKNHKLIEGFDSVGEVYNNQYTIYQNQITTSAILLGYAYFEAFLTDLMKICLLKSPKILIPEGKSQVRDKTLTYHELLLAESHEKLIESLVDKEIRNVMYKSMPEILDYFEKKLKLSWDKSINEDIITANRIRNCCMHNSCNADKSLAIGGKFVEGAKIELTASDVHLFGIRARQFSAQLWGSANDRYKF